MIISMINNNIHNNISSNDLITNNKDIDLLGGNNIEMRMAWMKNINNNMVFKKKVNAMNNQKWLFHLLKDLNIIELELEYVKMVVPYVIEMVLPDITLH